MRCVEVRAGRPYEVFIGRGLMDAAGGMIVEALGGTRMAAILTDDTVDALYGARVEQALSESGLRTCRFAMPHGEAHKTLATWEKMLAFLSEQGMTRADAVVALGGGVPGDVAGFAAACYQRGVDLVQIPTTLLAMIDSSVGGKTGVDLGGLKNQVGAFHQPRLVLIDPDALSTLPAATLSDGAAEAVKYGVLGDTELFERLSRGGWTEDAEWVIERCVFHKAALVAADELDRGSRQLLNLGHTLGHAIEKCSGFRFSHGQAVAVGMIYAARIARSMGLCGPEVEADIAAALTAGGLPLSAPYGAAELAAAAMADKKRAGGEITLVLPRAIGRCELRRVPAAELEELARSGAFSLLCHHGQMRVFLALYRQRHAPLRRAAGKQAALRRDEAGPGILSHAARRVLAKPRERRILSHPDGWHGRQRVFAHTGQNLPEAVGRKRVRRAGDALPGPAARPRRVAGRFCAGWPDAGRTRLRGQARAADARHACLRAAQPRAAL